MPDGWPSFCCWRPRPDARADSTNTWALGPSQPNSRNAPAARLRRICQTGRRITSPLKHSGPGGCIVRSSTRTDLNATMRLPRQPVAPTGVGPDDIFAPATHSVPLDSPAGLRPRPAFRPPTRPPGPGGDLGPRSPYRDELVRAVGLGGEYRRCYTTVSAAGKRADAIAARLVHGVVKPLVS